MHRISKQTIFTILMLAILLLPLLSAGCGTPKTSLYIIVAGSLVAPMEDVAAQFEQLHPDVVVQIEGHGSIQVIRQVTELGKEADVLMTSDYSLIPMMMYNTTIPGTNESYADWYLAFATNAMGIAYTNTSKYSDEINQSNWYEIMSRPDVTIGISDASLDSCGYRAFMTCQLAQGYYGNSSIFESLFGDNFKWPVTVALENGTQTIHVPEILEPNGSKLVLRGDSTLLLYLLDSGDVDYAFEYRSVALQHGCKFLSLPPQIDLSSAEYAQTYAGVRVVLDFQRFASVVPVFDGQPIIYGLTITNNAPHPDIAQEFVSFVISNQGQAILTNDDLPPLSPTQADNPSALPDELKALLQ